MCGGPPAIPGPHSGGGLGFTLLGKPRLPSTEGTLGFLQGNDSHPLRGSLGKAGRWPAFPRLGGGWP